MINKEIRIYHKQKVFAPEGETFEVERLLQNGMRTPDGTEIFSWHVHDYVTHTDENGETYMVDGGLEYVRRSAGHKEEPEDLTVYVDEDHEINREYFTWGSRGKDGTQPLHFKKLKDMSTAHIHAVLDSDLNIAEWRREIFEEELAYRGNKELDKL